MNTRKLTNVPLTDEQRWLIKYLHKKGKSPLEIRQENDLRRQDNSLISLQTVNYWINRFKETGDVKPAPKPGRKRILNKNEETKLVRYIKDHSKMDYNQVKKKKKLPCHRRTVNNYALRNKISKSNSKNINQFVIKFDLCLIQNVNVIFRQIIFMFNPHSILCLEQFF